MWQRFSAFLLGMIWRSGSHGSTSDTSEKSSLKQTKRLTEMHRLDLFCDTLSDRGTGLLLLSTFTAVRRAALCLRIMPSYTHRRCPRMLKQTVLTRRYFA